LLWTKELLVRLHLESMGLLPSRERWALLSRGVEGWGEALEWGGWGLRAGMVESGRVERNANINSL